MYNVSNPIVLLGKVERVKCIVVQQVLPRPFFGALLGGVNLLIVPAQNTKYREWCSAMLLESKPTPHQIRQMTQQNVCHAGSILERGVRISGRLAIAPRRPRIPFQSGLAVARQSSSSSFGGGHYKASIRFWSRHCRRIGIELGHSNVNMEDPLEERLILLTLDHPLLEQTSARCQLSS